MKVVKRARLKKHLREKKHYKMKKPSVGNEFITNVVMTEKHIVTIKEK